MNLPQLYDFEMSGNCHKIRLLLALLGVDYQRVDVDIRTGGSQTPEFLALNPRGQVPVFADGDTVIWDSMAILVYLARRYGDESWLPGDPLAMARVMQWLALSENEILYGLARARAVLVLKRPFNLEEAQNMGRSGLHVLEQQLAKTDWLIGGHAPSIADIACFPYVALAPQGGIPLDPYPAVQAWIARVKGLPGYVGMPGI